MARFLFVFFVFLLPFHSALAAEEKESAFDRVMKSQTIRCGWGTNDPWVYKDMKSNKMAGIVPDIMAAVAGHLDLKLNWPEETGWPNLPTSLETGRVDVACSSLWNDPVRGKHVAYTQPLFYTALHLYVRDGDSRFSGNLEEINSPEVRIVIQDGDISNILAKQYFPKAQLVPLTDLVSAADIYLNVTTGKADVTFGDGISIPKFNAMNEVKLKRIPLAKPITVYGNSLAVGIHDLELKEVIDNTVRYMIQIGEIEQLTKEFRESYPDAIVLPSSPYAVEK